MILFLQKWIHQFSASFEDHWSGPKTRLDKLHQGLIVTDAGTFSIQDVLGCLKSGLYPVDFQSLDVMRSFKKNGDNTYRRLARKIVLDAKCQKNTFIVGRRLANMVGFYDFFGQSADANFSKQFFKNLKKDYYFLRSLIKKITGIQRIFILFGLIAVARSYSFLTSDFLNFLKMYENDVKDLLIKNIYASPVLSILLLKDLIHVRYFFKNSTCPFFVQECIEKIVPFIRTTRHGDGLLSGFACQEFSFFNTMITSIMHASFIDEMLSLSAVSNLATKEKTGFLSVGLKTGVFLVNADKRIHFDALTTQGCIKTLQFEWSIGHQRVVRVCDVVIQDHDGNEVADVYAPPVCEDFEQEGCQIFHGKIVDSWGALSRTFYISPTSLVGADERLICVKDGFAAIRFVCDDSCQISVQDNVAFLKWGENESLKITATGIHECIHDGNTILLLKSISAHAKERIQWVAEVIQHSL